LDENGNEIKNATSIKWEVGIGKHKDATVEMTLVKVPVKITGALKN